MFDLEALIARLPHETDENDDDPDVAATVREFVDCKLRHGCSGAFEASADSVW